MNKEEINLLLSSDPSQGAFNKSLDGSYYEVQLQVKEVEAASRPALQQTHPQQLIKVLAQRIIWTSSQKKSLDVEQYLSFFIFII